jgi:hypothetical protein
MVTEEKVYETTDYVLDILDFNKWVIHQKYLFSYCLKSF